MNRNWKDYVYWIFVICMILFIILYLALTITTCMENQRVANEALAEQFSEDQSQIIKEREATEEEKAYYQKLEAQKKQAELLKQQKQKEQKRNQIMASETTFPNITFSGGVNDYDGKHQTWYDSTTAPHKDMGQWHVDKRGFYRDAEGYIVIAYTMNLDYGTVIQLTDNCWGKVHDHCPTVGTVDIYVNRKIFQMNSV